MNAPPQRTQPPSQAARPPRLSLSAWIRLGVVATVLSITLPLLYIVEQFAQTHARQQAGEALDQIAWQMRDALDRGMWERYREMSRAALSVRIVQGPRNPALARNALTRLQESEPAYAWIGLTDMQGKVLIATGGLLEGVDVSARPWFKAALQGPHVGDVHPAVLLAQKLPQQPDPWRFVDIAMPVLAPDGSTQGVLSAHLSWGWAKNIQQELFAPRKESFATDVWIVRGDGEVLLGRPGEYGSKLDLPSIAKARAGQQGYDFEVWPDGKRYVTSYLKTQGYSGYPGLGWIVLVRQPEDVAFASFNQLRQRLIAASGLICVLVLVLAHLLARRVARPLHTLSESVENYHAGDSGSAIPRVSDYREAYVLSHALSVMADNEHRHIQAIEEANALLEERVEERTTALHEANEHLGCALAEQAAAENAARENEELVRDIIRHANEAYVSINSAGAITAWNHEAERIFGWQHDEAMGQQLSELIMPPRFREAHHHGMQHFLASGEGRIINQRIELIALRRDGSELPIELTTSAIKRGDDLVISGLMHDISERKALEQQLGRQALQDALTGLPNRRALFERLPQALARADRSRKAAAILFLDLDGFKGINDRLGHEAGDELLRLFAQRLQSAVRQTDTVARLAGDEFTILLEALVAGVDDAQAIASKIITAMDAPFSLAGQETRITTSIGIALYPPGSGLPADKLMLDADQAMYEAKRAGKNQHRVAQLQQPARPD